jgi:hypothetical protein
MQSAESSQTVNISSRTLTYSALDVNAVVSSLLMFHMLPIYYKSLYKCSLCSLYPAFHSMKNRLKCSLPKHLLMLRLASLYPFNVRCLYNASDILHSMIHESSECTIASHFASIFPPYQSASDSVPGPNFASGACLQP